MKRNFIKIGTRMRLTSIGFILILTIAAKYSICLSQEQAIKKAEQFIIDNGYTSFPANKSKISFEMFDSEYGNTESVLERRHNTLQPKAFCTRVDNGQWHVGFLSTGIDVDKLDSIKKNSNLSGRAVIVDKIRGATKMAHKTPLFSYFRKL